MYDHAFSKFANHQIRDQATHKVGCQHGDCLWSLMLLRGFMWVCMGEITEAEWLKQASQ